MVRSIALVAFIYPAACVPITSGQMAEYRAKEDQKLRNRAAFDFGCTPDQVSLTDLGDSRTRGAEGCGHRATYVLVNWQWVMNSASETNGPPAEALR